MSDENSHFDTINIDDERNESDGEQLAHLPFLAEIDTSNWPEWLLESYGRLQLPSLHDFLLAQEKLSVEVRKQNREIKSSSEQLQELSKLLQENLDNLQSREDEIGWQECEELMHKLFGEEEDEEEPENEDPHKDSAEAAIAQQLLMQAMDSLFHLFNGIENGNQKILKALPEKTGYWRPEKPTWRAYIEEALEGYLEGIRGMRQKLTAQMADLGIDVINPPVGSPFDPMECRAVERLQGESPGSIAQLIRYGYKIKDKIIRFADVVIYQ